MMRIILRVITILLMVMVISTMAAAASGGLRYSVTVSKFENRAGWHGQWDIGDAWGTVLTDLLNQTGRFITLGEKDMRGEAMTEQDLAASGRMAGGKKAPATGQMTPAQLLVKGAITHVQEDTGGAGGGIRIKGIQIGGGGGKGEVNATIYVVDSTTGQVLASKSVVGTSTRKGLNFGLSNSGFAAAFGGHKNDNVGKALEAACDEAVQFILEQLPNIPWTGTVVLVKGNEVYVNRGAREGVSIGQEFVVGDVAVIRDPDTGEVLDEDMTEIARLKVDQVKEKLSICTITKGTASQIQKGMAIQLP